MQTLYKSLPADMRPYGFQYKIGEWYKHKGKIELCKKGFHASENIINAMWNVDCGVLARVSVKGESGISDHKQAWSEMRIDKAWKWEKKHSLKLAIYAAELVIDIFEGKFPDDLRPRQAIEAAKVVLRNDTAENRNVAESALRAAESAARAAYSAARAAHSAADSAAYSAAWAAHSAAHSAAYSAAESAARAARAASAASAATRAESAALSALKAAYSATLSAESAALSALKAAYSATYSAALSAESAAESATESATRGKAGILRKCHNFVLRMIRSGELKEMK